MVSSRKYFVQITLVCVTGCRATRRKTVLVGLFGDDFVCPQTIQCFAYNNALHEFTCHGDMLPWWYINYQIDRIIRIIAEVLYIRARRVDICAELGGCLEIGDFMWLKTQSVKLWHFVQIPSRSIIIASIRYTDLQVSWNHILIGTPCLRQYQRERERERRRENK